MEGALRKTRNGSWKRVIGTWIGGALFLWIQTAGIYYCFVYQGVGHGFAAVFLPPYCWYKSFEFTYRLAAGALPYSGDRRQATGVTTKWPDLSAEELSVLSEVSSKAMESTLTDSDVAKYGATLKNYCHRNSIPLTALADQGPSLLILLETDFQFKYELGRCILASFDTKQPFLSKDLERLVTLYRKQGVVRESKLEADLRMIPSAAYRTVWTDEFGAKHQPLSREEILDGIKRLEVPKANLAKLVQAIQQLATTGGQ